MVGNLIPANELSNDRLNTAIVIRAEILRETRQPLSKKPVNLPDGRPEGFEAGAYRTRACFNYILAQLRG